MIKRVYIDTSVVGGNFDKEFLADTKLFFEEVKKGKFILIVSDLLEAELLRAPDFVKKLLLSFPDKQKEKIKLSQEAIDLADKYIEAKVVGKTSRADCQHIAMATVHKADVLVSWNFKHIVHFDKIRQFNAVNEKYGYRPIQIYSSREVANYEEDI